MERFIIRFVLCSLLFLLCMSFPLSGKNFTPDSCPFTSFEGNLINHPYPLDNKCVMLKHFANLKQVLATDLVKHPEKRFALECKILAVEAKIDSINAAPFAFARIHELATSAHVQDKRLNHKGNVFSPLPKDSLKIAMAVSLLLSICCLVVFLKHKHSSSDKQNYHLGIAVCSFLVLAIIFGAFAF